MGTNADRNGLAVVEVPVKHAQDAAVAPDRTKSRNGTGRAERVREVIRKGDDAFAAGRVREFGTQEEFLRTVLVMKGK